MNNQINALADRFLQETQNGASPMSKELANDLRGTAISVAATLRMRQLPDDIIDKVADCYSHLPPGGILACLD